MKFNGARNVILRVCLTDHQLPLTRSEEIFARRSRCRVPASANGGDQRRPRGRREADLSTNQRRCAVLVTGGTRPLRRPNGKSCWGFPSMTSW